MPDRGLGAALEGALRGGVNVQTRKRERSEELEDQQRAQEELIARIRLINQLRQATREDEQAAITSRAESRDVRTLRSKLAEQIGQAPGFSFPGALESSDPVQLARSLADVTGVVSGIAEGKAEREAEAKAKAKKKVRFNVPVGSTVIDEDGNVIFNNPGPRDDEDKRPFPSLAQFIRVIEDKQQDQRLSLGMSPEEAVAAAAKELFGVDVSNIKSRGVVGLYEQIRDMFDAAGTVQPAE